jgi:hypothetical protein
MIHRKTPATASGRPTPKIEGETPAATAGVQPRNLDSSEGRGTAGRVSAIEPGAEAQRLEGEQGARNYGRRGIEGDDVSNRTRGGRTAKRAILEVSMRRGVVVRVVRKTLRRVGPRAHFQQKRRTGRRHEANRHIGAKQQRRQQQAAA